MLIAAELSEAGGRDIRLVDLPIGTWTNPQALDRSGSTGGLKRSEKKVIVEWTIADLKAAGFQAQTWALVDEVQGGSTISTVARLLSESLRDHWCTPVELHVLGARDRRSARQPPRQTIAAYERIMANQISGVLGHEVQIPLFTVDQPTLLDTIQRPGGATGSLEQIRLVPNDDARTFWQDVHRRYR